MYWTKWSPILGEKGAVGTGISSIIDGSLCSCWAASHIRCISGSFRRNNGTIYEIAVWARSAIVQSWLSRCVSIWASSSSWDSSSFCSCKASVALATYCSWLAGKRSTTSCGCGSGTASCCTGSNTLAWFVGNAVLWATTAILEFLVQLDCGLGRWMLSEGGIGLEGKIPVERGRAAG